MFFTVNDGPHGRELWRTNGTYTGTVLVRDIAHGAASSSPNHLVAAGGTLYFLADDGVHGEQLWKSDGTAAGTVMVKDLGAGSKNVGSLVAVGDRLYFAASTPSQGDALWTSLGTAATTQAVAPVEVGADTIAGVAGVAMFAGNDGTHGLEPWVSDGTASGTHMLDDIWPGSESSLPRRFTYAGGRVYFLDSYDAYLWTATVTTP
jgi:ELWxxDGT repeat protein